MTFPPFALQYPIAGKKMEGRCNEKQYREDRIPARSADVCRSVLLLRLPVRFRCGDRPRRSSAAYGAGVRFLCPDRPGGGWKNSTEMSWLCPDLLLDPLRFGGTGLDALEHNGTGNISFPAPRIGVRNPVGRRRKDPSGSGTDRDDFRHSFPLPDLSDRLRRTGA